MTILTEIAAQLPDNNNEDITPAILRRVLQDMVADYGGKKIFLYFDGQSNITRRVAFPYSPNPHVLRWNNPDDPQIGLGTAFAPLDATTINFCDAYASAVADLNPGSTVYIVVNGFSSQSITQWLAGASFPDMYANGVANVAAALTAAGLTQIDEYIRWQGEQDAAVFRSTYVADDATMMGRYWGNSWFPKETPRVIMGVASAAITSVTASDWINNFLRAIASADPDNRRFVYTSNLTGPTYWDPVTIGHGTGQGYLSFGHMGAHASIHGAGRGLLVDPVTGAVTAGNPVFTSALLGVSGNITATIFAPIAGTLGHFVAADGASAFNLLDTFNSAGGSQYIGRHAGGFAATLAATPADKITVGLLGRSHDGVNGYNTIGAFQFYTNGLQSTSNYGSYALLYLTALNSTTLTQAYRFDVGSFTANGATSGTYQIVFPAVAGTSVLKLPAGSTDFTATGGAHKFVAQTTAGGPFTVVQPVAADISGLAASATTDTTTQANVSFTGLSAAAAAADADTLPVNQGAGNLKQTFAAIKTWIKSWIADTDLNGVAWPTFSPTISASTVGTGASYTVNSATYKQVGKKVDAQVDVTIAAAGTAAGLLQSTLPVAAKAGKNVPALFREIATTGKSGAGAILSSDVTKIVGADSTGNTFIATGARVIIGICYEAA